MLQAKGEGQSECYEHALELERKMKRGEKRCTK